MRKTEYIKAPGAEEDKEYQEIQLLYENNEFEKVIEKANKYINSHLPNYKNKRQYCFQTYSEFELFITIYGDTIDCIDLISNSFTNQVLQIKARSLFSLSNPTEAIACLKEAVNYFNPISINNRFELVYHYDTIGDHIEMHKTLDILRTLVILPFDISLVYFFYSVLMYKAKKYKEAINLLELSILLEFDIHKYERIQYLCHQYNEPLRILYYKNNNEYNSYINNLSFQEVYINFKKSIFKYIPNDKQTEALTKLVNCFKDADYNIKKIYEQALIIHNEFKKINNTNS